MASRASPTVVLLSSADTLAGIDPRLRRAGVRLVRLTAVEARPVEPARWLGRLARGPPPDTVVVTSRNAVRAGVVPWRRAGSGAPASVEFWAVGPGTASALHAAGIRRVHRPRVAGALAVARAIGRTPRRRVVYFRSDIAGPTLARELRQRGHRVVDVVVYRSVRPHRWSARARRALESADVLVATSPSSLTFLRALGRAAFARLASATPLVVLGDRSRRSARRHGFRHISVAPSTTAQRFTRHLLRELRNARS